MASAPAFNRDLDAFCGKYLFSNRPISVADEAAFPRRAKEQNQSLFEQLLLFDTVVFKISGENVALAILISQIGLKGVEQLLEEGALKFVLWQQDILALVNVIPGVHPLGVIKHDSAAHSDPEQSIELGLNFLQNIIPPKRRSRLVAKILPHYVPQSQDLAKDALALTNSAYLSSRLTKFGLAPVGGNLENVPQRQVITLQQCAVELLEYKLLLEKGWSTLSRFTYYDLFSESVRRLTSASAVTEGFQHLATLTSMPNLPLLFGNIERPLQSLPRLRAKRSSVKFRRWLATGDGESPDELTRRYVDAIGESNGFFDRAAGKFVKSIAMTGVGAGVGASIEAGLPAATVGALAGKLIEPLADLGLDLLDAYLLDGLLKGWTPRLFFSDMQKEAANIPSPDL